MKACSLALVALVACSNSPTNVIATLTETVATVERMPEANATWRPARKGDTFVLGSAVRTGEASTAKLRVGKSGKLDVRPKSIVYFTRDRKRERDDLKVETGSVEIEAGEEKLGLGDAVLEPNARVRVEGSPAGTTIVVTIGRVVLEDNVIEAGKSITLSSAGTPVPAAVPPPVAPPRPAIQLTITGKPAVAKTGEAKNELAIGTHGVEPDTTIVTPQGGIVAIVRDGVTAQTAGPSTVSVTAGDALFAIAAGTLALEGTTTDAIAKIPGGTVRARGAASVHVEKTGTQVTSQRGSVSIETAKGTETLAPGESVTLSPQGLIDRIAPPPKTTVAMIEAGESPVIHDATAPTPVRIKLGCNGVVEVAKDRAFKRIVARSGGTDAANVLVPTGTHHYRVRCATGKAPSGTIRIAKDAGSRPLPKTAANTTIELDGRDYTVLYQNLLPELTLALRNAPRSLKYTFVVKGAGGEKRFESMTPKTTLPAGELREGKYTAWAELDGGRRSEQGRIAIEFDNAAASASIDGVEADGANLRVRGTVIEDSAVSVAGAPVELDRHRRFNAALAASDETTAVRIAHPKAGIHYYVIRNARD